MRPGVQLTALRRAWRSVSQAVLIVCFLAAGTGTIRTWGAEAATARASQVKTLVTDDGVQLACQWYPSPIAETEGKDVVPVIVVHGWMGTRTQYDGLARHLQSRGHAVVVPDLRGHGESTIILRPGENDDATIHVGESGNMGVNGRVLPAREGLHAATRYDMEAVSRFLKRRHDDGELNTERLCVVGVAEGAIIAMNWAARESSAPSFSGWPRVGSLVLISPGRSFLGATTTPALRNPIVRDQLSVLFVVGKQDAAAHLDTRRLYSTLAQRRPPLSMAERIEQQTLFLVEPETARQGADLLGPAGFAVDEKIAAFIRLRSGGASPKRIRRPEVTLFPQEPEAPMKVDRPPFANAAMTQFDGLTPRQFAPRVIEMILSEDPMIRVRARSVLWEQGRDGELAAALACAVNHGLCTAHLVWLIEQIEAEHIFSPVIAHKLRGHKDERIRLAVLEALIRTTHVTTREVTLLTDALRHDPHMYVRAAAAESLGRMAQGAKSALPALSDALVSDPHVRVRFAAAGAIGQMGRQATASIPALLQVLETENDFDVRFEVIRTLRRVEPDNRPLSGLLDNLQAAVRDQEGATQLRYIAGELDALLAEQDTLNEHTKVFRRNWLLQAIRE